MTSKSVRLSRTYVTWFAALAAVLVLVVPAATQGPGPRGGTVIVNGFRAAAADVLVKYRAGTRDDERQQLNQQMDADEDQGIGGVGVRRIHSRVFDTETLVNFLRNDPRVDYAEPNWLVQAVTTTPDDPQFGNLWGLRNLGQTIGGTAGTPGADISAPLAWDVSTGSRANVVAVVDTGIDYNHPDLAGNVWVAPSAFTVTINNQDTNCGLGTHGFRSIGGVFSCDPMDDNNHGTHVSGTIGGVGNNAAGVAGVNWTASIMGAKFLDASGSGSTADAINVIDAIIQAKSHFGAAANVRVLSNSWGGGGFSQALLDEINKANTNDMLFAAAAGNNASNNDTTPFYPANYTAPNVMAVAASTNTDVLASFSNYGATKVHLAAPGLNVLSTVRNGGYAYFSGTSMATPHVSGAAALLLSVCNLTTATLKSTLMANVDQTLTGWVISNGRLNVNRAIRACSGPATPDFAIAATPLSQSVVQGAGASYNVTVTASGGFNSAVGLSASGLPSGATATFTPSSLPTGAGSSSMAVSTAPTTPTGSYTVTITGQGQGGTPSHSTTVTLVVTAAPTPNFTLSASPATRSIKRKASATYTVSIARSGGFTGAVTLSLSGLPAGAGSSFSPNGTTDNSSTLTVTTVATTPADTYPLTITGTGGGLTRTTSVTLGVKK